jgi:hypothetical protein
MDTFVVSLNVELFRRLLERETDEPRRQALVRCLLAQEEAKLVELDGNFAPSSAYAIPATGCD